jgi:hypothetical protein
METAQPSHDDDSVVPPPPDPGPPIPDAEPPHADLGRPSERGDTSPWPQQDVTLPQVRVTGPSDMLAVVPHLLGFHPELSFVVIGAGGPRQRLEIGFRYNLPDPPGAEAAAEIADHAVAVLAQRGSTTVIAIGYGPGRLVTPVADAFATAARGHRLDLRELLRVENSRYWS